jgi:hypothetical protein
LAADNRKAGDTASQSEQGPLPSLPILTDH